MNKLIATIVAATLLSGAPALASVKTTPTGIHAVKSVSKSSVKKNVLVKTSTKSNSKNKSTKLVSIKGTSKSKGKK